MGIELDYIFRGKNAQNFLSLIARSKNLNLFKMKVVRNIVNLLWQYFWIPMFIFMFIPFFIYFALFITYATYTIPFKNDSLPNLNNIIRWCTLGFLLYNLIFLTFGWIWCLKWKFRKSVWIWFDLLSSGLNLFTIIIDYLEWE